MPEHIKTPTKVTAAGNIPKVIKEFIGNVNTGSAGISIARMKSPQGWVEPGQRPEFDEYSLVLKGMLKVTTESETFEVNANEAVHVSGGEWVQYSTPGTDGAEYIAVCIPAFSPDTVHRDQ